MACAGSILMGCEGEQPGSCRVARVGAIEITGADVAALADRYRPGPPRAEAERLLVEAAACLATERSVEGPIPLDEALACHRRFMILYEKDHPGPFEAWTKGASLDMARRLDALGVEPGPCGTAVRARPGS